MLEELGGVLEELGATLDELGGMLDELGATLEEELLRELDVPAFATDELEMLPLGLESGQLSRSSQSSTDEDDLPEDDDFFTDEELDFLPLDEDGSSGASPPEQENMNVKASPRVATNAMLESLFLIVLPH